MTRMQRGWMWLALVASGSTLYQATTGATFGDPTYTGVLGRSGCSRFSGNMLANSIDFCYLFDCNNGFFGGVINPCGSAASTADDFLIDCSPGSVVANTGAAANANNNNTTTTGQTTTNQTQTTGTGFGS